MIGESGVALMILGGCSQFDARRALKREIHRSKPMNILLVVAEDMSPQIECYGDHTVPTPNFECLASEVKLVSQNG